MSELYKLVGITRQSHHQYIHRSKKKTVLYEQVLRQASYIRSQHPRMGVRKLYGMLSPKGIGRDQFEDLLMENGFGLKPVKSYKRTTQSQKFKVFDNLITAKTLTGVNQLWVSDITYHRVGSRFYYITFITDVYSRKIVGYHTSKTLHCQANQEALKMALRSRKYKVSGLIHHSDRGVQYISRAYLQLLKENGIQPSMGNHAWENAHAERINGIIKQEYLDNWEIRDFKHLAIKVKTAVNRYNKSRPHGKLPQLFSPIQFEKTIHQNAKSNQYNVLINY